MTARPPADGSLNTGSTGVPPLGRAGGGGAYTSPGILVETTQTSPMLNVATWERRSRANGPGLRFVLWLQGCPILCPGCVNQRFLPSEARHLMSIDEAVALISQVDGIEGVTFSGGEPTAQADALAHVAERVQRLALTVVCYTGYTLEALSARADDGVRRLLAATDILIDGPYVASRAANLLWRGSSNQRVLFLSEAYRHLQDTMAAAPAQVEMVMDGQGMLTSGTWPAGFVAELERTLRSGAS